MQLAGNDLSKNEKRTLEKAAKGALSRTVGSYTSMAQSFAEAIGAGKQVAKAIELFKLDIPVRNYDEHKAV